MHSIIRASANSKPDLVPFLSDLYREIYADQTWHRISKPDLSDTSTPDYAKILTQKHQRVFILMHRDYNAKREGVNICAGFIHVTFIADEVEIIDFGIIPKYRGMGYATQLCEHMHQYMQGDGAVKSFLDVASSNQAALKFYQHMGYTEIARRKAYYQNGDDAICMMLNFMPTPSEMPLYN